MSVRLIVDSSIRLAAAGARGNSAPRLFEGAAREHGRELPAIVGRPMHVVHGVELAACFRKLAQGFVVRHMTDQRLLDFFDADGRRPHAAERDGSAGDAAGAVIGEEYGRRYDREVAMPAGEFHKGMAVALRPEG